MNKCTNCNIELESKYDFGLCYICKTKGERKQEKKAKIFWTLFFLIGISIVLGVRFFWAYAVYKDFRCTFVECRIQVNP